MEITHNWPLVKRLMRASLSSSLHCAIASVNEQGEPHVTPIGSLILDRPGHGYYFEQFTRRMPKNFSHSREVCILAVNSGFLYWLKSLLLGRFGAPPGLRLIGTVGEAREASEQEIARWQKRVRSVRFTRGHAIMWRHMKRVREIHFHRIETLEIGVMTKM
jgi:uncharacterized protein